jgi:hypothetical protein
MKTKLYLLVLIMMTSLLSMAQPRFNPEKRAERLSNRMRDELKLDTKAYDAVKIINLKYAKKKQEIMQSRMREDLRREKMKELKLAKNAEMKAVLTKKQYEGYLGMDIRRPMKLQMGREQKPQIQQPKK